MIVETLSTGDEVRSGIVIDTNAAHIAQTMEEEGIEVVRHSCVGDNIESIESVLREIGNRADIGIVTGGLGPTKDDVTSESAANAAGVKIVANPDAMKFVEDFFTSRNRDMSESNRKQGRMPEGSECIYNPVGTAPGFQMKIGKCVFFFIPGVPFEMEKMLKDSVLPKIKDLKGISNKIHMVRTLVTFGLPEASVNERISGLDAKFSDLKLGLRAKFPEIHVKLYAKGENKNKIDEQIESAISWIKEKLGDRILSTNNRSMEEVVGELLKNRNETIALAESCTGGLVSHWLTNVAGSSHYFLYSGVVYSNKAKINVLGVSSETINAYGAVHEETVKEMASRAREISGATYGLSTSGIAGPDGGTDEKPVGTVCIGLATKNDVKGYRFNFTYGGRRDMNKRIFAMTALEMLRMELLEIPDKERDLRRR
ncbi:MAG: competence/damage-inducible protein A [Deltaproteobacteria bacterium]|nr:competence/damage-inducible protein A [Deltaproteobacteria bacterium]